MYGSTLKQLRSIYGYSAKDFSEELGISAGYLSEIENNKKQPSLAILQKYADILELKLSTLILLTENNEKLDKEGKSKLMIRKLMLKLISKTAGGE
ncbi:DNA-binding protein [Loigolactobacillus coryniformis subsp. coryniformis]|uniref:helix-turn-helix domain-containing protein n=1 Tax=Loigolactobacillus coryniformis TaxID=1610 RepID=UPI0002191BC5|nr:helix-turn-helix transcriptional regulator [Loigolactobacillus coryniformis]ATO56135.1 transcriptional regulator [Loigolactobacillus coryniformis subsp. coryniformis KCTC 3167 = DSM 20001]MCL5458938.1 helix-turn-helix domain-containing protein [Loigolactobacillus coryniformis]OEH89155.1 DNA-binding protein [Loigolactobacillus coryniformis subsp. coryniformis]